MSVCGQVAARCTAPLARATWTPSLIPTAGCPSPLHPPPCSPPPPPCAGACLGTRSCSTHQVHAFLCTHTCISLLTYRHFLCTQTCISLRMCISVHMYTHFYVHVHAFLCSYTCVSVFTYMPFFACTHFYGHIHFCAHSHTCVPMLIYMCFVLCSHCDLWGLQFCVVRML